jgi:NifU-like protein involved in Fe-S cluster formation
MNSELEELYQEIILDHSRRPRNFGELEDATVRGVRKFPQRVKCAMLAWRALQQAFLQGAGESIISTETDSLT